MITGAYINSYCGYVSEIKIIDDYEGKLNIMRGEWDYLESHFAGDEDCGFLPSVMQEFDRLDVYVSYDGDELVAVDGSIEV